MTNKPYGGFPPIFVCDIKKEEKFEKEFRGFVKEMETIIPSLKDMIQKRTENDSDTPFFTL